MWEQIAQLDQGEHLLVLNQAAVGGDLLQRRGLREKNFLQKQRFSATEVLPDQI